MGLFISLLELTIPRLNLKYSENKKNNTLDHSIIMTLDHLDAELGSYKKLVEQKAIDPKEI
jgi:hypothetical protein